MARGISNKKLELIKDLNKKVSKKKSNIKQRYDVVVDIPRIDTNLRGKALSSAIETAQSFLNPNNQKFQYVKNEQGVVFTKSELTKTKILIDRINRVKEKALNEILTQDYTVEGRVVAKVADIHYSKMANMDERFQLKFDANKFESKQFFEKWLSRKKETYEGDFIKKLRTQYRENYYLALKDSFGDASDVQMLITELEKMDVNTFYRLSMTADDKGIDFVYDHAKRDGTLQELGEFWSIDLGLSATY